MAQMLLGVAAVGVLTLRFVANFGVRASAVHALLQIIHNLNAKCSNRPKYYVAGFMRYITLIFV
jgi:hypothetical protein